jgi:hypothetical protein
MAEIHSRCWATSMVIATALLPAIPTFAAETLRVAYAGSMGVVMDTVIGFARRLPCER